MFILQIKTNLITNVWSGYSYPIYYIRNVGSGYKYPIYNDLLH